MKVISRAGTRTTFSTEKVIGHLVLRGVAGEVAIARGRDVADVIDTAPTAEITTDDVRYVIDKVLAPGASLPKIGRLFLERFRTAEPVVAAPLHDHRVRLALQHAVDRRALAKALDRADLLESPDPFGYDPALARRLLAAAGHGHGLAITIKTAIREFAGSRGAAALSAQLGAVGVRTHFEEVGWPTWLKLARLGADSGTTLYHAGSGVFLSKVASTLGDEISIADYCRDARELCAAAAPANLVRAITTGLAAPIILASNTPLTPAERDHRRMRVWMWDECLVALVAWWPALTTASRINYCSSIADLASETLDDAVDEGACFETLEIMSHGGVDHGNHIIKMGHDTLTMADALKRAMCPNGQLIFSACGQAPGTLLRQVSKELGQAIRVSGYSGTGVPDGIPAVDAMPPDLHFMNGSGASAP